MASATSYTKILPSPILPVRAPCTSGLDHFFGARVGDHHLDLDLGQQIDLVFHAAIDLFVAFLAAVAAHFGDGHAVDADALQGFLHFFEFVRLDDGFDFLHGKRPLRFEIISFFAVHAEVQPFDFLSLGDAHADQQRRRS